MADQEKEKKYYIHDIETGYPMEVSKEQFEEYRSMWERFRPKLQEYKGTVIVTGTGGEMSENFSEFLKDSFLNNRSLKFFMPSYDYFIKENHENTKTKVANDVCKYLMNLHPGSKVTYNDMNQTFTVTAVDEKTMKLAGDELKKILNPESLNFTPIKSADQ